MASVLPVVRGLCRNHVLQNLRCSTLSRTSYFPQCVSPLLLQKGPNFVTSSKCQSTAEHAGHSHSTLWTAERALSAGLLGILPAAFAFPNTVLDYAAALALTAHVHWGIEAMVVDYVRPSVVGLTLAKVAVASVYGLSVLTLGGLFYFNYADVGLMQAIRMLWKL